jgi:superfamily II DNA or RNA helicase
VTDLRPYQTDVIGQVEAQIADGKRCIIIVSPTGSGKTIIAGAIIKAAADNGQHVMLLGHSREIVKQTSAKLFANDIPHGIIQAGFPTRPNEAVQIASVQTLWARAMRSKRMELPPADLIIVDECHHCPATTWRKIIESYPGAILIGLTATPCRGDGRGLGNIFDVIVECPQVADLIEQKFLVRTKVYAAADIDLDGVQVRAGDYVEEQLAERMDKPKLVGAIVPHYAKFGENRLTVCFATSVAHSRHIAEEFNNVGIRAEHLDGGMPKSDRDAVLARLAAGETKIVSNCGVLLEGWDQPQVACCILARPTKKQGLFRQMVGRVLRPAPGKANAIVLDHAGLVYHHGFVEDPVVWTLETDKRASNPAHERRLQRGYCSRLVECSNCGAIRIAGEACAHCGFTPQRRGEAVDYIEGNLALVDRQRRQAEAFIDPHEKMRWLGMLMHIGQTRQYKRGWAAWQYRHKDGNWPPSGCVKPIEPSAEVLSWVRSRNIAYAKAKGSAA